MVLYKALWIGGVLALLHSLLSAAQGTYLANIKH